MDNILNRYRTLMQRAKLDDNVIETFVHYLEQVISGKTGVIGEAEITPPQPQDLISFDELPSGKAISNLGIIKLNGGLGTSMGLEQAKSLITVKNGLNFLDVIALQNITLRKKSGSLIPLVFMNSFNTNEDTLEYLEKYPDLPLFSVPLGFTQNKYPRIRQDNFLPYEHPHNEMHNWNPPGHGDIFQAMNSSGILQKLLAEGIEYAFISNADNLGAVADARILNYLSENRIPFLMEVCIREEIDKKGGHLASTANGLILREIAQCPQQDALRFQDINLYRYFNTNNIWVNLQEVKKRIDDKNFILPLIVNPKTVENTPVFQIETAMGAAISIFPGAKALIVPRYRFAPVKKTSDLLTIRSDAYLLTDDYVNILNPECEAIPFVELDERYYKAVRQLEEHFPEGAPSLKKCKMLKVSGDVTFGRGVIIEGSVSINATEPVTLAKQTIRQ